MSFNDMMRSATELHDPAAPETEETPETPPEETPEGGQPETPETPTASSFEHIPESFRPPEFADSDSELKFYRENYGKVFESINTPEFAEKFIESYADTLASREKEIEDFGALMRSFKSDPKSFIAANFPDYASELGLQKTYSPEEIERIAHEELAKEFGENWSQSYDPADFIRPTSLSSKMLKRMNQITAEYETKNQEAEQARLSYLKNLKNPQQATPGMDDATLKEALEKQYEEHFKDSGMTTEDYQELVKEAQQKAPSFTMKDLYRALRFDDLVAAEAEKAREEGRKAVLSELKKAGKISKEQFEMETKNDRSAPTESFSRQLYQY